MEVVKSGQVHVDEGVPQGSILGPVLFSIYVNEIGSLTTHASIIKYDDNTAAIVSASCDTNVQNKCNVLVSNNKLQFVITEECESWSVKKRIKSLTK